VGDLRRRLGDLGGAPDLKHLHHRLGPSGWMRQTCYVFYGRPCWAPWGSPSSATGILAVVLATSAVLASTVAADLLQKTGWRVRVPYVQALLR
jgi:hypothetical protein